MELSFTKMHGTGNDYVVVDGRQLSLNWNDIAAEVCQRRFGVGADGLLVVAESDVVDIRMRMFNPDGSEAEMCGNGLRCFTKFVLESNIVAPTNESFLIETAKRIVSTTPHFDQGYVKSAQINMGHPLFDAADIPINRSDTEALHGPILNGELYINDDLLLLNYVSMGNPHAVFFMETPIADFELHRIGPLVENHTKFPKKMNFHIANIANDGSISMRSWERGAGETWSCGSGACAVGVAASLNGHSNTKGIINVPGGTVTVHWDKDNGVLLNGPVEKVYTGTWAVK